MYKPESYLLHKNVVLLKAASMKKSAVHDYSISSTDYLPKVINYNSFAKSIHFPKRDIFKKLYGIFPIMNVLFRKPPRIRSGFSFSNSSSELFKKSLSIFFLLHTLTKNATTQIMSITNWSEKINFLRLCSITYIVYILFLL